MTRRSRIPPPQTPPGAVPRGYRDHIVDSLRVDPYEARRKYPEPTACPGCGLVFHEGRWQRGSAPDGTQPIRCPACQRIADRFPAGFVTLSGPFLREHREELLALVRNEARHESDEHPLHRLMDIEERDDEVLITTTDLHLPRRIGEALERAYDGALEVSHTPNEYLVRVHWSR